MKNKLLAVLLGVAGLVAATFAFGPRWLNPNWTCPDTNNNGICD
jgi:hypothetical protein